MPRDLIVVAGGGGFLGGHLVKRLLAEGSDVRAVDVKPLEEWSQSHDGAENLTLDLQGEDDSRAAVAGAVAVYDLVANAVANTILLAAAQAGEVSRFLSTSHDHALATNKGAGADTLTTRIARYQDVYGPGEPWRGGQEGAPVAVCRQVVEAMLSGNPEVTIQDDGQSGTFIYVDDCIEGIRSVMESDLRETVTLNGSVAVGIDGLVTLVKEISAAPPRGYAGPGKQGESRPASPWSSWAPKVPLREGLEVTYRWVFEQVRLQRVTDQVEEYRRSGGAEGATMHGRPVVLITTIGSSSGRLRTTPVMRVEHEGAYALIASKGGGPLNPAWYRNIIKTPRVELQDGPAQDAFLAHETSGDERAMWWQRAVEAFPGYADYETRTDRQIPVVVLEPTS
jgi:F420H(2)-dependent quinone reductase